VAAVYAGPERHGGALAQLYGSWAIQSSPNSGLVEIKYKPVDPATADARGYADMVKRYNTCERQAEKEREAKRIADEKDREARLKELEKERKAA
jgi:hypothetical protein